MTPKQLVAAWVEAFNRRDVDALAGFYAEKAINHQVAEPAPLERPNPLPARLLGQAHLPAAAQATAAKPVAPHCRA